MSKTFPTIDRRRPFSKGDYLVHVSGVVGIATGEIIYEPKNPLEKTKVMLGNGFPLIDYCVKFCPATKENKRIFIDDYVADEVAKIS